jgi:hypothetical protein
MTTPTAAEVEAIAKALTNVYDPIEPFFKAAAMLRTLSARVAELEQQMEEATDHILKGVNTMRITDIKRMWVNQPSSSQLRHDLHGTNVIAVQETDRVHCVFFLSGPAISCQIPNECLSAGWLPAPTPKE